MYLRAAHHAEAAVPRERPERDEARGGGKTKAGEGAPPAKRPRRAVGGATAVGEPASETAASEEDARDPREDPGVVRVTGDEPRRRGASGGVVRVRSGFGTAHAPPLGFEATVARLRAASAARAERRKRRAARSTGGGWIDPRAAEKKTAAEDPRRQSRRRRRDARRVARERKRAAGRNDARENARRERRIESERDAGRRSGDPRGEE